MSIIQATVIEYTALEMLLADKSFERMVSSESENQTLPSGMTTSFKNWCNAALSKSRFVTERKICQSYPLINFDRCRIPTFIYMTRCCAAQVMNKSLECREIFYNIQVLKAITCSSNDVKDYERSSLTIPVSCVCVLPRSLPEPVV